jgi:hypothetical protein
MHPERNWRDDFKEAQARVAALQVSLPKSIEAAALGVRSKAPFQLLAVREALIWRTEELGRNACDALDRQDFAAAGLLIRGVLESAALLWHLLDKLRNRAGRTPEEWNDALMRVLGGTRTLPGLPQAINILTCVDQMDKKIPGIRKSYDSLSEYAHPNFVGVVGLFSVRDEANLATHFQRGARADITGPHLTNALIGSLIAFDYCYNKIADEMPAFLSELEPF